MPQVETQDDGAELVERGGFRVDRSRALEKIRSYRRGDVGCAWLFLRAAYAAGAADAVVRRCPDGFTVEFDGEPFPESVLADPYAALFQEEGAGDARRWLALGVIHAFGPGLRLVSVESGHKDDRRRFSARDVGQEVVAAAPNEGALTVVRVKSGHSPERHWRHPLRELDQVAAPRCLVWGKMRADVDRGYDSFSAVPPGPVGSSELAWAEGGVMGRLGVPSAGQSAVDLHICGVYAGTEPFDGKIPVVGKLEHSALSLDAAFASHVRNEVLSGLLGSAHARAGELVAKVAAEHVARRAEVAQLMDGNEFLERFWQGGVHGSGVHESDADAYMAGAGPAPVGARTEAVRRVRLTARNEHWLRIVAARTEPGDPWAGDLEACSMRLGRV